MRYLGEETKERIVHFVDGYYADNGYTPTIACGAPVYAEQQYGDRIVLPEGIAKSGEHFILRASGHSMINAGIDDGDY